MMIRGLGGRKMDTHLLFQMGFPLTFVDHICQMMMIDGMILMMVMTIVWITAIIMIMVILMVNMI